MRHSAPGSRPPLSWPASYPMVTFRAVMHGPPVSTPHAPVVVVSSNKGGVGKTTLAANLAIYVRALLEDLPVLALGLDDQEALDRMFALGPQKAGAGNLKHGWAQRDLQRVIQLGEYGVHFVPSPPDVSLLKGRAENPVTLRRILERTAWPGIVVIDTKADLEALTLNAFHAADRILIPVADWGSLEEAGKIFRILERSTLGVRRARVVFTLVDRRARGEGDATLFEALLDEVRRRGWVHYETYLSRSPRVEALNSATSIPLSILHHARGTAVHVQMRELTQEVLEDLGLASFAAAEEEAMKEEPAILWGKRRLAAVTSRRPATRASELFGAPRRR